VIFCVADEDDPVVPLVRRLMAEHPETPTRLLVGEDRISINPKLNNVVKGWKAARYDWVLMADSNLLLPKDYIQVLMARWTEGTGMVCSPPVGGHPTGFWAELECAFLNEHEAFWQLIADGLGVGYAQGKTLFLRKEVLDSVGGIEVLAEESAEDAAATKVIRRAGLHVRLVPGPFVQPLGRRSFAETWGRQVRWGRLRRESFPVVHFAEILVGLLPPLVATAILVAIGVIPPNALIALVLAWYASEAFLTSTAGWHLSWRSPVAWVLRDLLLPVLWISAWTGKRFNWRGTAMNVAEVGSEPR
jgi:ceramide glucosyltransferase